MNASRSRSAANTLLFSKGVKKLEDALRKKVAKVDLTLVTSLATNIIVATVCIEENTEKISPKKGTLKPTGSSFIVEEQSTGMAMDDANNVITNYGHHESEYSDNLSTAAHSMIGPQKKEAFLHVKSKIRGVQLITLYENPVKKYHAPVAQGIVKVVPTKPFFIKVANWSNQLVLIPKQVKIEFYQEAPTSCMKPQHFVLQMYATIPEGSVNAKQNCNASEQNKSLRGINK